MKKISLVLSGFAIFNLAIFFCGCGAKVSKSGIENYSPAASSFGICSYLLPSGEEGLESQAGVKYEFLENYEYIDGNYYYRYSDDMPLYNIRDTALMWLQYDAEIYEQAKAYMFEITPLSEDYIFTYNDYYFYERVTPGGSTNMLGYNDSKNILVFYGYYFSGNHYETEKQLLDDSDWQGFLKEFFPDYDFDQ